VERVVEKIVNVFHEVPVEIFVDKLVYVKVIEVR
jgi:hypothetical protein